MHRAYMLRMQVDATRVARRRRIVQPIVPRVAPEHLWATPFFSFKNEFFSFAYPL
jgi:hypothetical protein